MVEIHENSTKQTQKNLTKNVLTTELNFIITALNL